MKQRFKITTYIMAIWRFLFGKHVYDLFGDVTIVRPIHECYTFDLWLKIYKEQQIVLKHSLEYLMDMTPRQIAEYKV